MAGNKQRFTYEINADIGQAKKAINDLQQSIEKLSKAQINADYLDKGINNAVGAAKELQFHLNAALNQNTGKINLNAFTQSLQQSNTSAKDLMQTLLQGGAAGQQTFTALASAIAQSEVPLKRANKTLQDFATTLKNTVKWEISSTMVHGLESALSGAVSYAKNLNTSLTNIRIVTGQTVEDMARFTREANVAAKALSTTTKAYADASLIYYQQGDSQEMAAKKAAITIKASNASFETSAKEMSEYLTAVWNSYQVGADELERYVDIMANLGAKTATSLEEIATSMQKVAATANTVGVSMEQVSSIIATVSSVTRESAESIGTSYKTIFARIGDLKLGKVDEDGVGLGQVSSQLDAIGVKILDGSGNLREMGDIIMDLGNKWQTMNQAQKTAVAQVVAGKRQYTQLMALFENWDMFQGNMNIAENSEGALQKMQDTYAESWEGASARAQAAIEGIYRTILNDQAIIKMINGLADLTTGLNNVIEGFGGLGGVITTLGGLAMRVFKKQISSSIDDTLGKFTKWSSQFKGQGFFEIGKKIATGSAKSAEQIKHEDEQARWQSYMKEMKVSSESEGVALNNSAELLNMKERLIDAEYRLSDAQKSRAQYELSVLAQEQERLLTLTQEREELDKQIESQDRQTYAEAARTLSEEQGITNRQARDRLDSAFAGIGGATSYESALGIYRKNVEKVELSSRYSKALQEAAGDSKELEKIIQRIKNAFGDEIEASLFNDATEDATKLIAKLKTIEQEAQQVNEKLEGRIEENDFSFSDSTRTTVRKALDDAAEQGRSRANIRHAEEGINQNIGGIKQTLTDLFDADSAVSKSLGSTLATVADLGMSAAGAFYDGAEAIRIMNDESATLGDKLGLVASTATNLATSFASGGVWGLAITAVVGAISYAIAYFEQKKKEYQEKQTEDFEKSIKKAEEKEAELSNIQSLIQNYNSLKATYESTGEGQDAVAASARELAEAMGLVGANVLIAENNFKGFERLLSNWAGWDETTIFYEKQSKDLRNQLFGDGGYSNSKSKYWDTSTLVTDPALTNYPIQDTYHTDSEYMSSIYPELGKGFNYLIPQGSSNIGIHTLDQLITEGMIDPLVENYISASEELRESKSRLEKVYADFTKTEATAPWVSIDRDYKPFNPTTDYIFLDDWKETYPTEGWEYTADEIKELFYGDNYQDYVDAIEDFLGPDVIAQAYEGYASDIFDEYVNLFFNEQTGTYIIGTDSIKRAASEMEDKRADIVNYYLEELNHDIEVVASDLETRMSDEEIRLNTKEELATQLEADILNSPYWNSIYTTGVYDSEGNNLFFTEGVDVESWMRSVISQRDMAQRDYEAITADLATIEESIKNGENKYSEAYVQWLKMKQEEAKEFADEYAGWIDADAEELLDKIAASDTSAARSKLISSHIKPLIGKTTQTLEGGFSSFVDDYIMTMQTDIDYFASQYEELEKYLKKDAKTNEYLRNDDGTYQVLEEFKEEYNEARDGIIAKLINQWTELDDFTAMYQTLNAYFDKDQFNSVKTYLSNAKIGDISGVSDIRLIDSTLLWALNKDLSLGKENKWINSQSILERNAQYLKAEDALSSYLDAGEMSKMISDDMTFDEAKKIHQAIKNSNMKWEEFLKLDANAKIAFINSQEDYWETLAKKDLQTAIDDAETTMKNIFGKETLGDAETAYKDALIERARLYDKYNIIQDGQRGYKEGETFIAISGDDKNVLEQLDEQINAYESSKEKRDSASDNLAALDLSTSDLDDEVKQLNRMAEAISNLPADMEEFNKLVKQLGDIDPKKLVDMSNLERAELILNNLSKPQKSDYWNTITYQDENGQEQTKKEFDAARYADALRIYEETRIGALNIITENAEKAFARIETRANQAREEAEKTKAIAETLNSSIDSGYLTETQKLNMSPELISQWESASSAAERGAIAAQVWAQAAIEITSSGEEMRDAYQRAGTALQDIFRGRDGLDLRQLFSESYSFTGDNGQTNFTDFIRNQIKDPELQDIWNKAFSELAEKTKFTGMSDMAILEAVKAQIGETSGEMSEELQAILAGIADNTAQTFESLAQQNIDAAQKAADAWLQAFNTIKNARETLLSGGDILDQIAGDPEAFMDLMQSTGLSADALYDMILSNDKEGLLAATRDYIKSDKYVAELLKGQGFVTDKFGSIGKAADVRLLGYKQQQDGTWQDQFGNKVEYDKEIMTDVTSHWAKLLENSLELTPEDSKKLAQQIWEDPLLYRENLKEPAADLADAIRRSTDLMTVQADRQEKLAAVEYAADTQNLKYDENGNIIVGDSTFGAMINGQTGTYEEYEKLASAIANAQEAKTAGESWETLSQADQDLLAKYNINFDNVDESANSCATALAACAEAAYQLAMAAAGDGYKYDEKLGYHTNKNGQQDDQSRVLDKAYQSKESAWDNVSDVNRKTTESYAKSADLSYEELEGYTNALKENNKIIETNKEKQMELASVVARQEKALDKAKNSYKDWMKILNNADSTTQEQTAVLEEMRETYEDLFDLTEDESGLISDEFLKSAENAELLKEAIKGNEDAWDDLKAAVAKDIFSKANLGEQMNAELSTLADTIAAYDFEANGIKVGASVETADFYSTLDDMVFASYDTAQAVSAGLSSLGVEANLVPHSEPLGEGQATVSPEGSLMVPTISPNGTVTYKNVAPQGSYTISADGGMATYWTIEGATYNGKGVTRPSGGGGGKKGGSGGGGSKKEKKEKLRARDEIPRYHKNEKVLESIESTLTEIDKLKDRAYGADHVAQLDAETEALKRQLEAQQALKEEAESYIPQDKGEFLKYGAQFDADGVITNYEDVMQAIMDEYNQAIEDYNNSAQEDSDKERLEEAKQKYDDLKDSIEKYEEAIQKAQDAANEMLEIQNRMSELELEKITYKLELEIEVNDSELEIIDYYKNKYEDSLKDQDEYFNKLVEANVVYEENLTHLREAEEELNAKYRAGLINDADYAEGLADIQSQMLDNLNSIEELKDEIAEAYENTLEMAREQIEEITDLIDGSISSIESYINILELSGRERDYDTLKDMYEALYQNNFAKININKAHLDSLKAEEDALLRKYNGDSEAMSEADKERHMVLRKQIQETQDALNEATEATLETLRSGFEVVIQSIGDELDHFMAGASDSLAHLQEQYDYYTETQGRYVSAAKELYEVSKLNRDIENSLTTATSSAAKEALKALQEKINKQSELNELTEYDIEMNQLQYQLLLARIKLEETQNAKDIVRLTRDENGNYAYRYTANQDKIDEAAQHYEDVLQQINDLTVQRTNEIESQIVSTMQNYKEKLMQISLDYSLTEEERLLKLEELNAQYAETMQYLQEQNNIVTQNLTDNQSAIAEHYGTNISNITASTAGNVNSSVQSMIDKANEYIAAMNGAIYGEDGILANWEGYMDKIDDVNEASGTSYENLREEALATTEILEGFQNQALDVIDTLENTLTPLSELTKAWDAHGIELDDITDKYENIVEVIQATRNAMNNFGGGTNTTANNGSGSNRGVRYATGGLADYTGLAWLDGTPEKPELVLNPTDTENLITAVGTVRSLDKGVLGHLLHSVKTTAESMMSAFNNLYHAPSVLFGRNDNSEILTQDIHITAEFPNATDRNEIEEALLGLANRASQFASRQKK